jgi:hypothetical protein
MEWNGIESVDEELWWCGGGPRKRFEEVAIECSRLPFLDAAIPALGPSVGGLLL